MKAKLIAAGNLIVDAPTEFWDRSDVDTETHCLLIKFDSTEDLHKALASMSAEFEWPAIENEDEVTA